MASVTIPERMVYFEAGINHQEECGGSWCNVASDGHIVRYKHWADACRAGWALTIGAKNDDRRWLCPTCTERAFGKKRMPCGWPDLNAN